MLRVNKINQWLQMVVLLTIPLEPIIINNVAIILLGLTVIVSPYKGRDKKHMMWIALPFVIYFLSLVAGYFYSPGPLSWETIKYLENKTSLIFIPILLVFSQPIEVTKALNFFVRLIFLMCLWCLASAVVTNYNYNQFHRLNIFTLNPWFYTYGLYSDGVNLHQTYFSLYVIFSLVYVLGWRREKSMTNIEWSLAIFFGINLLLLMSRVLVGLALVYFVVYLIFGIKASILKRVGLLVFGLLICTLAILNPVARTRINDIFENDKSNFSGTYLKLQMWGALYREIISEHFLFGIGAVNQDERIREVYKRNNIMAAYNENYNCHNQFIESLVHNGVTGLITLLLLYGFYLFYGIRMKNRLLIGVMVIFIVVSIVESVLLRQKGIVFFSFIIPFLAVDTNRKPYNNLNVTP